MYVAWFYSIFSRFHWHEIIYLFRFFLYPIIAKIIPAYYAHPHKHTHILAHAWFLEIAFVREVSTYVCACVCVCVCVCACTQAIKNHSHEMKPE